MPRRVVLITVAALALAGLQQADHGRAQGLCTALEGAAVIASDGTYLGSITPRIDAESVFNEIGIFGNRLSPDSIWNELGTYGGKLSVQSPFNEVSPTPPALVKNSRIIAHLTVNDSLLGAIDPLILKRCFR